MPRCLLLILSIILLNNAFAQQHSISGKVIDTSENRPLANAVVSLIRPTDSILIKFTRTQSDGSFLISPAPSAPFILMITYPNYADYVDNRKDSAGATIQLGNIVLTKRSQLLEAVIVRQQISAIRMKGDTLAFLADSFKVSQGATVDELLKKLPGIQVDRNGQITAQGEKVNKVLVDGEEFFSEDPAVVIKNLQAEAVKEVQVYDKKSDQAEFTGIDDGERSKTINLTLKADKKKGYYLKAGLSGGTDDKFDNDLMVNSFKGSRKIAAYGIMSNTGRAGLDWQDNEKFGGGENVEYNEEEGYFMYNGGDDALGEVVWDRDGLPTAWSAGLHFSNKWNGDNKKVNGNYRFLKKNMESESSTYSQYILPDTQYFNNETKRSFSTRTGHQIRGIYELKFDTSSNMKLTVSGTSLNTEGASRLQSEALNADSAFVNRNQRLLSNNIMKNTFQANLLWKKKFKKKGRTLSLNLEQQLLHQDVDGLLQSNTDYYNGQGDVFKQENIDQKKNNTQNNFGLKSTIVYTEPLAKTVFLSLNYGFNFQNTEAFRNSFNKGSSDFYDDLDPLYSNDFRFGYNIHRAGADIKFNKKKLVVTIGSGVSNSAYKQTDLQKDSSRRYSFVNYYPKVSLRFNPRQYRRISIAYNGDNNPPSLTQLQPVRENTDPLNIQLGNPALRQEFSHNLNVSASDFKIISERNIYLFSRASFIQNAISTATTVDAGKTTYQAINVNGNYNMNAYSGYGWKWKKPGIYINLNAEINMNHSKNVLNGLDNANDFSAYNLSLGVRKNKNEKYSVYLRSGLSNNFSKSSLRPDAKTNFISSESYFETWIKLPLKFEFYTEGRISLRQKTDISDRNNNVFKWDANIAKKFLKNNNLELKLSVNDILDQNIGFERTANTNIITERRFLSLRRYFLLGIRYNISKNP